MTAADRHTTGQAVAEADPPIVAVPAWLRNTADLGWRVLVISALIIVLWFVAKFFWVVTASVAVGIVITAVFAPAVLRLRDQGRSRNSAALIVWTISLLVICAAVLVLAIAFLPYLAEILRYVDQGVTNLQASLAQLSVPPVVGDAIGVGVRVAGEFIGGPLEELVGNVASAATIVLLAIFLVFFLLRDGDKGWLWIFGSVEDEKRDRITVAGREALTHVGGYLRGTTVIGAIVAVTTFVFMLLLGVPLALPVALFAFMAAFIPYFGGLVTTIVVLLVTFGASGGGAAAVMFVLIASRNLLISYGLRPALYGRTVKIHPAVVLVALPAGFQLAGVVGLFAAVPVVAVVSTVTRAALSILEPDTPPQHLPAIVPSWLDRAAQVSWRLIVLIGLGALATGVLVAVPLVVFPIMLGLILAATLDPVVRWLVGRGRSRSGAAAIAVAGGILVVGAMIGLAVIALVADAPAMADTVNAASDSANAAAGGQLGILDSGVSLTMFHTLEAVRNVVANFAGVAVVSTLGALLAFYFLRDGGRLWARMTQHGPPAVSTDVHAAGREAFEVLGGYMLGTAAISFVGAGTQWLIMIVLGLPHALPVFVLSFFLCFIPYIGGYISTGIALLIAWQVGTPLEFWIMFAWTMVFNIVQGNVVAPIVYGKTVHIHPAIVLLAIPAGAAAAGILGMFIAVPAIGVVAVSWRAVIRALGSSGVDTPPTGTLPKPNPAGSLSPTEGSVEGTVGPPEMKPLGA